MNDDPLHPLQRPKGRGKAQSACWMLLFMPAILFFVFSNLPCDGILPGPQQRISCQLVDTWEKRIAWLFMTLFARRRRS